MLQYWVVAEVFSLHATRVLGQQAAEVQLTRLTRVRYKNFGQISVHADRYVLHTLHQMLCAQCVHRDKREGLALCFVMPTPGVWVR